MNLQEAISWIAEASNQDEAIRRAYDVLIARYHGGRVKTYLFFWRLFENDTKKLWSRMGFLLAQN